MANVRRNIIGTLLCLVFSVTSHEPAAAAQANAESTQQQAAQEACAVEKTALDPSLSLSFMRDPPAQVGRAKIVVGHFDEERGLLAGYQSPSGKRIMFRSKLHPGGKFSAEILHINPETNQVGWLVGRYKSDDDKGTTATDELYVGGFPMAEIARKHKSRSDVRTEDELRVRQFLQSESGEAIMDGIPALYAALESIDRPELLKLKMPYGATISMLQAVTRYFRGFVHAEDIVGRERLQAMRDACGGDDCAMHGRGYTIRKNGLFDVVTKPKSVLHSKGGSCKQNMSSTRVPIISAIASRPKGPAVESRNTNGDGKCSEPGGCFGVCGYDCYMLPGQYTTAQCTGHDYCVCAHGWASCLFTVPNECGASCSTFIEAALSYFAAAIVDWFESWVSPPACTPPSDCSLGGG